MGWWARVGDAGERATNRGGASGRAVESGWGTRESSDIGVGRAGERWNRGGAGGGAVELGGVRE